MSTNLAGFLVPGTDPDVAASYAAAVERARDAVFGFEDEVVLVDIETTGFDPARDHLIEVAAARMRGPEVLDVFHTLVDPGCALPAEIAQLTGITDAELSGAPAPDAAAEALAAFVDGRDIVAHNAPFDRAFLEYVAGTGRFTGNWIDTLQLALIAFPRLSSHRLRDLAQAFGGPLPSHRAAEDVRALGTVWRTVLCGLELLGPALLGRLVALAPLAEWPARPVLSHLAAASAPTAALDLAEARRHRAGTEKARALPDAAELECAPVEVDDVVAEFSAAGAAGRMYDEYEHRDEQAAMARTVTRAFSDGTFAAVEAGTGVGKSLAYLMSAARFALKNNVAVGVATKTNALSDQLVYGELPALCRALGEPLRFVSLKGYEHYLCLRRLDRFVSGLADSDAQTLGVAAALLSWVAQSSWGDRAAINVHLPRGIRTEVTATAAECTRKRCRYYPNLCYVHGMRRRAASAHVLVTNHALLFRDLSSDGGILPPIRHWVVDEAHAAESEARNQLSMECSRLELAAAFAALGGSRGLTGEIRRQQRTLGEDESAAFTAATHELERGASEGATLAESFFEFTRELGGGAEGREYDTTEVRIDARLREGSAWGSAERVGRSLVARLDTVLAAGRRIVTLLEAAGASGTELRADLVGVLSRAAGQREALVAILGGESDEYVYHVTVDNRPSARADRVGASRLDVGEALAEAFFPHVRSVVFTSATIATGDDFGHFARAVGLDRLESDRWEAVRLPSSYDFQRQMAAFVPADLPSPREDGYLPALADLLFGVHVEMGGSVLTLFTNRREMEQVYRLLAPRLTAETLGLLVQSKGTSTKRLRDEFLADQTLSLFATKSFWEGFDAKGDTLRCVVVPKLPFGPVHDPLTCEREERYGRAAWRRYYLPQAILELKQAAGRLIRSSTDRGCLVIADTRVLEMGYGREFLAALPVDDVERLETDALLSEISLRFGRDSTV